MERVIEVFVELDGVSHFVGRLWSRSLKGRESASIGITQPRLISRLKLEITLDWVKVRCEQS